MKQKNSWIRWAMISARSWQDIKALIPETGIDMVDKDHRIIIEFGVKLNILAEDVGQGLSINILERQKHLLENLLDYTRFHFQREQELIEALQSPMLERQRKEHQKIVNALEDQIDDFATGRLSVSPELRRAVFRWIVDHVAGTDTKTFSLDNLSQVFETAGSWAELRQIIRTTGVDQMDREHRQLAEAILELVKEIKNKVDHRFIYHRITHLQKVTAIHFQNEELFMQNYQIPGYEIQKNAHAVFLTRLSVIENELERDNSLQQGESLAKELLAWLADHVNRLDYDSFRKCDWLAAAFENRSTEEILPLLNATGISQVDQDHQNFIIHVGSFWDTLVNSLSVDQGEVFKQLDHLITFAADHFITEEALFPDLPKNNLYLHLEEHRNILANLNDFRSRLIEGRIGAASAVKGFLMGWWLNHTNGTDIETFGSLVLDGRGDHEHSF